MLLSDLLAWIDELILPIDDQKVMIALDPHWENDRIIDVRCVPIADVFLDENGDICLLFDLCVTDRIEDASSRGGDTSGRLPEHDPLELEK